MTCKKPVTGQLTLEGKLVAEITSAFYSKAEKENLDPKIVSSAVRDVQEALSGRVKGKQCFLCQK